MKNTAILLALLMLSPVSATAQDYYPQNIPGMSQMDMQKIQQMQKCMASIDQKQLQSIEQLQNEFDAEMKSLCASGKRDEAQKKAMAYAKRMTDNPAIKAMQKCGEITKDMMPDMPVMEIDDSMDSQHVCDSY